MCVGIEVSTSRSLNLFHVKPKLVMGANQTNNTEYRVNDFFSLCKRKKKRECDGMAIGVVIRLFVGAKDVS